MTVQTSTFEKVAVKPAPKIEEVVGDGFDVKKFVSNFEVLAEAEGSIKKLREMVVGLALSGRIVPPRDPVGHSHPLASRTTDAPGLPPIPSHWSWVHLEAIITFGPKNGYSPKAVEFETPVRTLTLTATTSGRFDGRFFKYIDEEIPSDSEFWLRDGDVLIQRGNTIEYVGVAAVYRGPPRTFIYPDLMMKVRVCEDVDLDFAHMALNGPTARRHMMGRASGTSGTMPKINQGTLLTVPIPLPPLSEQKRIVAKVDELMRLLDDLEAKQLKTRETQAQLRTAALRALTSAEGPEEFETAWKRVAGEFGTLFERADILGELRAVIRDLAVSGHLLHPTERAVDSGTRNDGPFVVPARWIWSALGDLAAETSYGTSQKAHEAPRGVPVLRMNNIQDGRLDLSSLKYVPSTTEKLDELMLVQGDLLFNRTNSYELVGKMAVFREAEQYTFASYLICVRLDHSVAVPEYVNLYFGSSVCRRTQIEPHVTRQTNQANFNGSKLREIRVPTPPLAEQKRIVAKVEQLMKLCDDLEAKLIKQETTASRLVQAVVAEMVGG